MEKVVYKDGDRTKAVTGTISNEDDWSVSISCYNGKQMRIAKNSIVSISTEGKEDDRTHSRT